MTMRRKRILLPMIAVSMLLGVGSLAACGEDSLSEDDVINMGFDVAVVFDFAGGTADDKPETKIRVSEGSYVPEPGNFGLTAPVRSDYSLKCYRVAELDEDGKVKKDEGGNAVLGREWDFQTDKATEDTVLYAEWWKNFEMVLHYGENLEHTKKVSVPRTRDGEETQIAAASARVTGFTFIDYYRDKDFTETERVEFPAKLAFSDEKPVIDIYSDSLEGTYQLIRKAEDFLNFAFSESTNIYMMADVDMTSVYESKKTVMFPASYKGKFVGRGYKISNLEIERTVSGVTDSYFGLFKTLDDGAEITNLTFENATIRATLNSASVSEYCVGLLAGLVRGGAKLEGVNVTGTVDYTMAINYDSEKITIGGIYGSSLDGAVINSCKGDVSYIRSMPVYTQDEKYAVYVKYTQDGEGNLTIGDVYGLTEKNASGSYSSKNLRSVKKNDDGSWTLETHREVYTVTVGASGAVATATVVLKTE